MAVCRHLILFSLFFLKQWVCLTASHTRRDPLVRYANYHNLLIRYANDVVEVRDYVAQAREEGNEEGPLEDHCTSSENMHCSGDADNDAEAPSRASRRPRFEVEVFDQQHHSTILFSCDVVVIATGLMPQYVGGSTDRPRTAHDGSNHTSSFAHDVPIPMSQIVANLDVLGEDYSTFDTDLGGFEVNAMHNAVHGRFGTAV